MKNLHIIVLTTSYPVYDNIAVGIHVMEKCRHLVEKGMIVNVLAPGHQMAKKRECKYGVNIKRFSYFFPTKYQKVAYGAGIPTNIKTSNLAKFQLPFFFFSFFINALKMSLKADIIHCHWSIAGLIGVFVGKITRKKVVFMMHGAEVFVLGDHPILKFVLKNVDFLISNSSFTEKKTLEVYPVKNHKVISPGVNLKRFYPQHRVKNLRNILKIPNDGLFVLTIGKFIPRKGFEYLIKAFDIIINKNKITDVYLRIGGRGPLKSKYVELINKYGLQKYIDFTGYITDEDIPSFYTEADIFVLPSIVDDAGDTEGLGVVFLEANACKTPVIGSKVGGIRDVIKDGENGFLVEEKNSRDIADKLSILIKDAMLRKKMGEEGQKIVRENFNWNIIAKEIVKVYKGL